METILFNSQFQRNKQSRSKRNNRLRGLKAKPKRQADAEPEPELVQATPILQITVQSIKYIASQALLNTAENNPKPLAKVKIRSRARRKNIKITAFGILLPEKQKNKLSIRERVFELVIKHKGVISYKEIAKVLGISRRYAITIVDELCAEKKLIKKHTQYIAKKYPKERNLAGKNIYSLPKSERKNFNKKFDHHIYPKNPSKEGLANKGANFSEEYFSRKEKFDLFERYGFGEFVDQAPDCWFNNPKWLKELEKGLPLLRNKISRHKYKCKNFFRFMNHLIYHGVHGYKRHVAKTMTLALAIPTIKRVKPFLATDSILAGYEALKTLHKQHGLDVSFDNMEKLLRRGFGHLSISAQVMLKRLRFQGVRNVTAFLHFIIGLKDPMEILRKKEGSQKPRKREMTPQTALNWLKKQFAKGSVKAIQSEDEIDRMDGSTAYAKLMIHKTAVGESRLSVWRKVAGQWVDKQILLGHPQFMQQIRVFFEPLKR
jgi:hypothetical protein